MNRTGLRTEHWGTARVRGDEGEMCGGMTTADVRDERYEVNHCSEREENSNEVERRRSKMEWLIVSKATNISKTH